MLRASAVLAFASLLLANLACFSVAPWPSERRLIRDAAQARRTLVSIPRERGYPELRVDLEKLGHSLVLRMPEGRLLRTSEVRAEGMWRASLRGRIGNPFPNDLLRGRAVLDIVLDCSFSTSGGSYHLEFEDDRLVAFSAGGNEPTQPERCRPGIAASEGAAVHSLPLAEEDLTDLFGPFLRSEDLGGGGEARGPREIDSPAPLTCVTCVSAGGPSERGCSRSVSRSANGVPGCK